MRRLQKRARRYPYLSLRLQKVSLKAVVDAVKAGADTVEKVGEVTGAGTGVDETTGEPCGKCKPLIQNIIDLGR